MRQFPTSASRRQALENRLEYVLKRIDRRHQRDLRDEKKGKIAVEEIRKDCREEGACQINREGTTRF